MNYSHVKGQHRKGEKAIIYLQDRKLKKEAFLMGSEEREIGLFNKKNKKFYRFIYDYGFSTYETIIDEDQIMKWC